MKRTRAEARATREAILDAAEQAFLERGVARSSLEHVAQRAGVTRGAIYWHFRDKSDLFSAMLDRVRLPMSDLAEAYRRDEAYASDPLGLLQEICRHALAKLEENETYRNVYRILMNRCEFAGEMNPAFERQLEIDAENLQKVEADFRAAYALGQLAPHVQPRIATRALYSLMHGIYLGWLRAPDSFAIREDGEAMLELFFAGLRKPG